MVFNELLVLLESLCVLMIKCYAVNYLHEWVCLLMCMTLCHRFCGFCGVVGC